MSYSETCFDVFKYFFGVTVFFLFSSIRDLVMADTKSILILFVFQLRRESIQKRQQYMLGSESGRGALGVWIGRGEICVW